jgi:hypothetical protein
MNPEPAPTATGYMLMIRIAELLSYREIHELVDIMRQLLTTIPIMVDPMAASILVKDIEIMDTVTHPGEAVAAVTTTATLLLIINEVKGHPRTIKRIVMTPETRYWATIKNRFSLQNMRPFAKNGLFFFQRKVFYTLTIQLINIQHNQPIN